MMKKQYAEIPYGYPPPYAYQRPSPAPEPYASPGQKTRRKAKKPKEKLTLNGFVYGVIALACIAGLVFFGWAALSEEPLAARCDHCGSKSKNYFEITVRGHVDYGAESVGEDVLLSAAAAAGGHVDTEEHFLCNSCYGRYIAFWRALS